MSLLDIAGLSVAFSSAATPVVADVSFTVRAGEAVGIVGESGSGKSLSMLSLLQLLPAGAKASAGHATFAGEELLKLSRRQIAAHFDRRTAVNE